MSIRQTPSLVALLSAGLLVTGLAACASSKAKADPVEKLRATITEVVADPARAAQAFAAVDEIGAAVAELDALVATERSSLVALLRDRGSSRADVEASLAKFNAAREATVRRVLTAHVALKAAATEAEWKTLRKPEMEMISFVVAKSVGQASPAEKEG